MYRRWLSRLLRALIILVILGFWGRALWGNWLQVADYGWRVSWPWLALSLVVLSVQVIVLATAWWWTLILVGPAISWGLGLALWLQSQLARYVPGGVWDIAARLALGQQAGISKRTMSASVGLEMGLQILSAAPFVVLALLLRDGVGPDVQLPVGLLLALGSCMTLGLLIGLTPPVFSRLVNVGLRVLRRPPLSLQLTYGDMLVLFLARILAHGLMGLGVVLFARGVAPIPWDLAPLLITGYVAAWLIGYLAIPVPTGIGVREGILVLLLGGQVSFAVASGIALGYRAWIALRDLLAALGGFWLGRLTFKAGQTTADDVVQQEPSHRTQASD